MENVIYELSWDKIGVITGVLFGIVGVIIANRQNKSKRLSYEIISFFPLFKIDNNFKNDIEIKFKGEPVSQIYIIEIKLENLGNVPIKKDDFEESIKFEFQNCKHIFSFEILECSPEDLTINITINSNEDFVLINPLLLNPSDSMTFKIILEGDKINTKIKSRIVGIKEIENKKNIKKYRSARNFDIFYFVTGLLIIIFLKNDYAIMIGSFLFGWGIARFIPLEYFRRTFKQP